SRPKNAATSASTALCSSNCAPSWATRSIARDRSSPPANTSSISARSRSAGDTLFDTDVGSFLRLAGLRGNLRPTPFTPPQGRDLDPRWPRLVTEPESGRIMCGQRTFRQVRPALWDVAGRLAELDAGGVGRQLVSPVPVALVYWAQPGPALDFARHLNDGIAQQVAESR